MEKNDDKLFKEDRSCFENLFSRSCYWTMSTCTSDIFFSISSKHQDQYTPDICQWNVCFNMVESVIVTQRAFRDHFLFRRNAVLDRKSILMWFENFWTSSSIKRRATRRLQSNQTPENVQTVRQRVVRSPTCSVCKHVSAKSLSDLKENNMILARWS